MFFRHSELILWNEVKSKKFARSKNFIFSCHKHFILFRSPKKWASRPASWEKPRSKTGNSLCEPPKVNILSFVLSLRLSILYSATFYKAQRINLRWHFGPSKTLQIWEFLRGSKPKQMILFGVIYASFSNYIFTAITPTKLLVTFEPLRFARSLISLFFFI